MNQRRLVMFAGPNGSGKSTITPSFQAQPDFPIFDNTITPQLGAVLREGEIVEQGRDSPQWIAETINNYQASKDEKISLIQKANNSQQVGSISSINKSQYTGKIEFVGEHYASQKVSSTEIILHHLSLINFDLSLSETVTIKYNNGVSSIAML